MPVAVFARSRAALRAIDVGKRRWVFPVAAVFGLGIAAAIPVILRGNQYQIGIATLALIFAIFACGWNVVSGFAGQFSVGHAAFIGLGAYVGSLLYTTFSVSPWLGMLAGGAAAGVIALLIGFPAFRLRGPYFALTTIAFGEIVRLAVSGTDQLGPFEVGGPTGVIIPYTNSGIADLQFASKTPYYEVALGLLVLTLIATWFMARSRMGHYWAGLRTDQDAAASLGVPVLRYKCIAALISGFIVGAAGVFYAQYVGFIDPNRVLGIELSIQVALMGMVGGRGTVFGPMIGAIFLYPVADYARAELGATSGGHLVVYGVVLVLSIYFLPKGIAGLRLRRRRTVIPEVAEVSGAA